MGWRRPRTGERKLLTPPPPMAKSKSVVQAVLNGQWSGNGRVALSDLEWSCLQTDKVQLHGTGEVEHRKQGISRLTAAISYYE